MQMLAFLYQLAFERLTIFVAHIIKKVTVDFSATVSETSFKLSAVN